MDPPVAVDSVDFVIQDVSTATALALALDSHGFGTETKSIPIPTTPGHGIVHLGKAVDPTTFAYLLCLGRKLKHEGMRQHQPPQQKPPVPTDHKPPPKTDLTQIDTEPDLRLTQIDTD